MATQDSIFRKNIDFILKAVPIIIGIIYFTGYIISLIYFRYIKVQSIDLLKASCLETGITFYLLSFSIVGTIIFPFFLLSLIKKKRNYSNKDLLKLNVLIIFLSILASIIAFDIALIITIYITLFLTPGEFSIISHDFLDMTIVGLFGFCVLIFIFFKGGQLKKIKFITPKRLDFVSAILRVLLLIIICYYSNKILEHKRIFISSVLKDYLNLYYVLFLAALSILTWRLFIHISGGAEDSKLVRIPLIVIWCAIFYITLISYVFGPHIYIPTNRGGGYYYNPAILITNDTILKEEKELFNNSNESLQLYFLSETKSYVYVTPFIKGKTPREDFNYIAKGNIFCLKKKSINHFLFRPYKSNRS